MMRGIILPMLLAVTAGTAFGLGALTYAMWTWS